MDLFWRSGLWTNARALDAEGWEAAAVVRWMRTGECSARAPEAAFAELRRVCRDTYGVVAPWRHAGAVRLRTHADTLAALKRVRNLVPSERRADAVAEKPTAFTRARVPAALRAARPLQLPWSLQHVVWLAAGAFSGRAFVALDAALAAVLTGSADPEADADALVAAQWKRVRAATLVTFAALVQRRVEGANVFAELLPEESGVPAAQQQALARRDRCCGGSTVPLCGVRMPGFVYVDMAQYAVTQDCVEDPDRAPASNKEMLAFAAIGPSEVVRALCDSCAGVAARAARLAPRRGLFPRRPLCARCGDAGACFFRNRKARRGQDPAALAMAEAEAALELADSDAETAALDSAATRALALRTEAEARRALRGWVGKEVDRDVQQLSGSLGGKRSRSRFATAAASRPLWRLPLCGRVLHLWGRLYTVCCGCGMTMRMPAAPRAPQTAKRCGRCRALDLAESIPSARREAVDSAVAGAAR